MSLSHKYRDSGRAEGVTKKRRAPQIITLGCVDILSVDRKLDENLTHLG